MHGDIQNIMAHLLYGFSLHALLLLHANQPEIIYPTLRAKNRGTCLNLFTHEA